MKSSSILLSRKQDHRRLLRLLSLPFSRFRMLILFFLFVIQCSLIHIVVCSHSDDIENNFEQQHGHEPQPQRQHSKDDDDLHSYSSGSDSLQTSRDDLKDLYTIRDNVKTKADILNENDSTTTENTAERQRQPNTADNNSKVPTTRTIHVLDHVHDLDYILKLSRYKGSALVVILAYRESCEQSMELLWKYQYAIQQQEAGFSGTQKQTTEYNDEQQQYQQQILHSLDPIFVQMPVNINTVGILDQFSITDVPTLFFMKEQGYVLKENTVTKQLQEESDDDKSNEDDNEEDVDDNDEEDVEKSESIKTSNKDKNDDKDTNDDEKDDDTVPIVYVTDYIGPTETISDILHGIYHYLIRLRHSTMYYRKNTINDKDYLDAMTIPLPTIQELQKSIVDVYKHQLFHHVPLPINPYHSDNEKEWIQFLMDGNPAEKNEEEIESDNDNPFYIICQCRQNEKDEEEINPMNEKAQPNNNNENDSTTQQLSSSKIWYREFDQIASVLSTQRNVLFCVLDESCDYDSVKNEDNLIDDGTITVFTVHPEANWTLRRKSVFHPSIDPISDEKNGQSTTAKTGISDFLSVLLRPTILWLDRKTTAPIALHSRYARHAALFVDFHNIDETTQQQMRDTIRLFRKHCQLYRTQYEDELGESSIVCLVVPSTDTRILTTFGIDVWNPLDQEVIKRIESLRHCYNAVVNSSEMSSEICEQLENYSQNSTNTSSLQGLPALLITERRKDGVGIQRYYLDPPLTDDSIKTFFDDFVNGRATSEVKTQKRKSVSSGSNVDLDKVPQNNHGIYLPTGDTIQSFLKQNQEKHLLLQLYATTCGHCKRFNIIWNSLGDIIHYIGWDDRIILARIDVSMNEIFVPGMSSSFLPDLYYFGVNVYENPVHYLKTEMAEETELGSVSDPLDLLLWWIDEAGDTIDERALLKSLDSDSD